MPTRKTVQRTTTVSLGEDYLVLLHTLRCKLEASRAEQGNGKRGYETVTSTIRAALDALAEKLNVKTPKGDVVASAIPIAPDREQIGQAGGADAGLARPEGGR